MKKLMGLIQVIKRVFRHESDAEITSRYLDSLSTDKYRRFIREHIICRMTNDQVDYLLEYAPQRNTPHNGT